MRAVRGHHQHNLGSYVRVIYGQDGVQTLQNPSNVARTSILQRHFMIGSIINASGIAFAVLEGGTAKPARAASPKLKARRQGPLKRVLGDILGYVGLDR